MRYAKTLLFAALAACAAIAEPLLQAFRLGMKYCTPKRYALPRLIQFAQHQFVKKGHGKAVAGGSGGGMAIGFGTLAFAIVVLVLMVAASSHPVGGGGLMLAGMGRTEDLTKLLDSFNALQDDMRSTLDKQTSEIKAQGESSEETGRKVAALDKLLAEARTELNERIEKAENEIARASLGGTDTETETAGSAFAKSDEYREMVANNGRSSRPVDVGSFFGPARPRADIVTADVPTHGTRLPGIVTPGLRMGRVRDLLNMATTTDNSIEYIEETGFTNNAEPQVEKAIKGISDLSFALRTAPVRTLAHWIPATRQVIADVSQLRNYIDTRLIYGLKVVEDAQLLYGIGTGAELQGLMTNDRVQHYYGGDAVVADADHTMIDSVRLAMVLTEDAEYPSDGVVLNHRDWAKIETLKGDDGHYLWVNVTVGGTKQLWRVPVVSTSAMVEGEFLVGAFGLAATLWDREQANVRISESHADFFVRNQVVILAEERLALANYRPEAFVNGSFAGTDS